MKEKYYICPHCFSLTTYSQISKECEEGGNGLCDCDYVTYEWSETYKSFEPVYWRKYHEYEEVTREVWKALEGLTSYERKHAYSTIPKKYFIKKKRR
jgi:phage terminase large subunit GpA-like protein